MENYMAKANLHLQEFGCTVKKGTVISVDGDRVVCGALEGTVGNSFRLFVKGGMLVKVEGDIVSEGETIVGKPKELPKMKVVEGDENRIELKIDKPWEAKTDKEIIDIDNGKKIDGMKVVERETVDIGTKVKEIPNETKEVQTKNGIAPRNAVKEKKDESELKAEVEQRKAERLAEAKKAEEKAAAEEKKTEAKTTATTAKTTTSSTTTKPATTTSAQKTSSTSSAAKTTTSTSTTAKTSSTASTKPSTTTTAKPATTTTSKTTSTTAKPATTSTTASKTATTTTKPAATTAKTDSKSDIAVESEKIKMAPPVEGVSVGKSQDTGMSSPAETIKIDK